MSTKNIQGGDQLKQTHFPALDWLRAVAAISVFTHHCYQQFHLDQAVKYFGLFMLHLGAWGVSIFFVLSGFCIHWARLVDQRRGVVFQTKLYAARRFFRIYPAFLFSVLICFFIEYFYTSNLLPKSSFSSVLMHLTLISSFFVDHRVDVNNVLWSVVVECHFYILYGLFWQYFNGVKGTSKILTIAVLLSVVTFIISVTVFPSGPYRVMMQSMFLASWWTWCLGALTAEFLIANDGKERGAYDRYLMVLALTASLTIAFLPHPFELHARRFLLPIMAAVFLFYLLRDQFDFSRAKHIVTLGLISYSLYLFHPIAILIGLHSGLVGSELIMLTLFIGIVLAYLGYRFVEIPFVGLGKRYIAKIGYIKKVTKFAV